MLSFILFKCQPIEDNICGLNEALLYIFFIELFRGRGDPIDIKTLLVTTHAHQ